MADFSLRPVDPIRVAMDHPRAVQEQTGHRRERRPRRESPSPDAELELALDDEGQLTVLARDPASHAVRHAYSHDELERLAREPALPGRLFERRA